MELCASVFVMSYCNFQDRACIEIMQYRGSLGTGKFFFVSKKWLPENGGDRETEVNRKFLQEGRTNSRGSLYQVKIFISCKFNGNAFLEEVGKCLSTWKSL